MSFLVILIAVIALFSILLSAPPAIRKRSWLAFVIALLKTGLGIALPVVTFFLSAFLVPEWKGDCAFGWIGSFHLGKLILTPLVVWASCAFYRAHICPSTQPTSPWIRRGLLTGVLTSGTCFLIGLFILDHYLVLAWGMAIPFYTFLWYAWLCAKPSMRNDLRKADGFFSLIASLPFWFGSLLASWKYHMSLPDNPPDCFIVTAASSGHRQIVGTNITIQRAGKCRTVNQQLMTFWTLEQTWSKHAPQTHHIFRAIYNRLGSRIAKRITNPFIADLVYLCLKPFEWGARTLIILSNTTGD